MVPRGRTEPGHFGALASVGLGVCAGESLVAPRWRMDGLAICPRAPLWGPDSEDGSGLRGEGAERKAAEGARGGRATVAMEGAARYSGIRILSAEDWVGGVGWRAGEGDGEASVFPLSLACSCIPTDGEVPSRPRSWPPAVPSLSCLSASCTEGRVAPSRRPVYQHDNGKLVLLKGVQCLSLQTSSLQRGPVMPSPWNLLKRGLLCFLIDFLPPTTLNAFNLLFANG